MDAADHLRGHQDLYLKGSLARLETHYLYAPSFAVAFIPFLWVPSAAVAWSHTLFHIAAYPLLYFWWDRIFRKLELDRARESLAWLLPLWLVFSAFWGDLNYLNIYIPMALLGTLVIEAVLEERLGWSILWLSIILQIKPHWAFAAAVPLLLGHYRFFWKLALYTAGIYAAVIGLTILGVGPQYGWQQHRDYIHLLQRLRYDYPWREPHSGFMGYNHSIAQTVIYLAGVSTWSLRVVTLIKGAILLPLAVIGLRYLRTPGRRTPLEARRVGLLWAFALYMGMFIWLDVVWEVTLGIALFTYLITVVSGTKTKVWLWFIFLVYALADLWQMISYLALGDAVLFQNAYVVTDPNMYLPVVMLIILTFYAVLVVQLWKLAVPLVDKPAPSQLNVETAGVLR